MKLKYLFIPAAVLLLSSCHTIKESTATTASVVENIYQYPTVADVDVKAKTVKTVQWNFVPFNLLQPTLANRKMNAVADLIKEADADILLEQQISYTKESFGIRTLTISGYPAVYKQFRKATDSDLKALQAVGCNPSEVKVVKVSGGFGDRVKHFFSRGSR